MKAKTYQTDVPPAPSPLTRPERQLWRAVLRQALLESRGKITHTKTPGQRDRIQSAAMRWIASPVYGTGSFLWVCDHLGCDPDRLRDLLAQGRLLTTNREQRTQCAIDLYQKGLTLHEIAAEMGVSYGSAVVWTRPVRR